MIRISIYDFFAYTLPGSFYLAVIFYTGISLRFTDFDFQRLSSISTFQTIALAIIAYVIGIVFDPAAKRWYWLFKPKDLPEKVLTNFKKEHPLMDIKFKSNDWSIILAYLRSENQESGVEIERYNANNIMLRNISFGLIVLAAIELVRFFQTSFLIWHLVSFIGCLILSFVTIFESVKFARWFYLVIYETITAKSLNLSKLLDMKKLNPQAAKLNREVKKAK